MEIHLQFAMNKKLYIKDPDDSELGRKIISQSICLINDKGFEEFTFKKLAIEIGSTEAGIYRYFENKQRILTYLSAWYWSWLEYQIQIQTTNMKDSKRKLHKVIDLVLMKDINDTNSDYINVNELYRIITNESVKTYHNNRVSQDNKDQLFKPYKELCAFIANIILEFNPKYAYPKSLASTIIEVAHSQVYFKNNLPSLTDYNKSKDECQIISFLESFVFASLER